MSRSGLEIAKELHEAIVAHMNGKTQSGVYKAMDYGHTHPTDDVRPFHLSVQYDHKQGKVLSWQFKIRKPDTKKDFQAWMEWDSKRLTASREIYESYLSNALYLVSNLKYSGRK